MTSEINLREVAAIDREIDGGFRSLIFSQELERQFEDDRRRERERYLISTGLLATLLYASFLFCDWQMTPDVFLSAVIVRLGIFTPLFGVTWYVLAHRPPTWLREGISSFLAIISVILTMRVLVMSRSPDLASYQHGTVLIMLFSTIVQRLRMRYAILTIVSILCVQLIALVQLHDVEPKTIVTSATFYFTATVLLCWAAYSLEREQRRSYLFDLRGRILNGHLDLIANLDALTGLWNRRYLEDMMAAAVAVPTPRSVSVILLDIDHFKAFNDAYGHVEGDICLKRIGTCLRRVVDGTEGAIAVRYGGEEFLILMDGADSISASHLVSRIQAAIKDAAVPHPSIGDESIVTASFGIVSEQVTGPILNTLIKKADDALYSAKHAGRNCVRHAVMPSRDKVIAASHFDFITA